MEITFSLLKQHIWATIINATQAYFLPLRGRRYRIDEYKVSPLSKPTEELNLSLSLLPVLREAVCENQGLISQYWYKSGENHKRLKNAFYSDKKNRGEVEEYARDLLKQLNSDLFRATKANFELLHSFFGSRDKIPPRICIKGYFKTADKEKVITVFRDRPAHDYHDTLPGSNAGFDHVVKTGRYFLCNDVPLATYEGRYRNPRLDYTTVEAIKKKGLSSLRRKWDRLWTDDVGSSHYSSTLIIPMTFANNWGLDDQFMEVLDTLPHQKRTIFGYLCIDHVDPNYFIEELDVSVGYMFADFIATYLFARAVFIEISKTFREVDRFLEEPSYVETDVDYIQALTDALFKSEFTCSVREIEPSSEDENHLWRFDDELLEFVSSVGKSTSRS